MIMQLWECATHTLYVNDDGHWPASMMSHPDDRRSPLNNTSGSALTFHSFIQRFGEPFLTLKPEAPGPGVIRSKGNAVRWRLGDFAEHRRRENCGGRV